MKNTKDKQCDHCNNYIARRDALKKHLESRRNTFEVSCKSHSLSFHSIENIYESEMGGIGDNSQNRGTFDFFENILKNLLGIQNSEKLNFKNYKFPIVVKSLLTL